MSRELSHNNVSFQWLKGSSDFMLTVLDNISSCVMLLNNRMEIYAFNDALKTIFSNHKDEDLLYRKCGDAIGCAYMIDEFKQCGESSHCKACPLRISAVTSYMENKPIYKNKIVRPFYTSNNIKVEKTLQFSTRLFVFNKDKYIMLIVEDVSPFYEEREIINTDSQLTSESVGS